MKQEEMLLLQDIAARVPYELKGQYAFDDDIDTEFYSNGVTNRIDVELYKISSDGIIEMIALKDEQDDYVSQYQNCADNPCTIENFKPYLRPLTSMTDAEREYLEELSQFKCTSDKAMQKIDFYNSHFLDCRGLIKKELALEAPEGMYTKN